MSPGPGVGRAAADGPCEGGVWPGAGGVAEGTGNSWRMLVPGRGAVREPCIGKSGPSCRPRLWEALGPRVALALASTPDPT